MMKRQYQITNVELTLILISQKSQTVLTDFFLRALFQVVTVAYCVAWHVAWHGMKCLNLYLSVFLIFLHCYTQQIHNFSMRCRCCCHVFDNGKIRANKGNFQLGRNSIKNQVNRSHSNISKTGKS